MADTILPITFNKGMNTVVPPLMAEPGTLIDCLNYEVADTVGYRRISGYEYYDGYPDGNINEYYRITITAADPDDQSLIIPGSIILRSDLGLNPIRVGVVVGGPIDTYSYDVVPFVTSDNLVLTEEFLLQQDGASFINLQSGLGLLKILGDDETLGSTFEITTPTGVTLTVTVDGTPTSGGTLITAQEYLDNIRAYSQQLRNLVQPHSSDIAGIYWMEDRLYGAANALEITVVVASASTQPVVGALMRWDGIVYRLVKAPFTVSGTDNVYTFSLVPVGVSGATNDDLVGVNTAGTAGTTWRTAVTTNGNPSRNNSRYAYLFYYNNTDTSAVRGFTTVPPANEFTFDAGNYSSAFGPPMTFSDDTNPTDAYYVVNAAGTNVFKVRLANVIKDTGDFTVGTATGTAQVILISQVAGTRDYLIDNDEIHTTYPTTGSSRVLTVNGVGSMAVVAGTLALDEASSRYQWETFNFYGHTSSLAAYGTTGASKAFWVNKHGWGTISTKVEEQFDKPRYVSFHAGSLALGFKRGSVVLSVVGEPGNFNGLDGAVEIATGDRVTGLLELPGDTLAIFGKRTIRKLTGITDVRLGTISGSTGCFDYTAVLIGQNAVFCGVNGITTLEQTAAYGDFSGQRLSDNISNYLRPKLVTGFHAAELGGVAMAYPVRTKNQYRLVLYTGEQIFLTITSEGPKASFSNYALTGELRVPYAWSSEISASGRERLHAVWSDKNIRNQAVELESGWGFNGKTFKHYFDLTHIFFNSGATFGGIEKVRLYGQGYGVGTLQVKTSGIEEDFDQDYTERVQDISIPREVQTLFNSALPVTNLVDTASWGLGVKLRITGTTSEASTETEPTHNCQAVVLHIRSEGARDG